MKKITLTKEYIIDQLNKYGITYTKITRSKSKKMQKGYFIYRDSALLPCFIEEVIDEQEVAEVNGQTVDEYIEEVFNYILNY